MSQELGRAPPLDGSGSGSGLLSDGGQPGAAQACLFLPVVSSLSLCLAVWVSSGCGSFGKVRQLSAQLTPSGTSIPDNKGEADLPSRTHLALEVTFSFSGKSHTLR